MFILASLTRDCTSTLDSPKQNIKKRRFSRDY